MGTHTRSQKRKVWLIVIILIKTDETSNTGISKQG